ncbi:MAG: 6-phosphogluconolactonase [Pseudomonadota bacterium]
MAGRSLPSSSLPSLVRFDDGAAMAARVADLVGNALMAGMYDRNGDAAPPTGRLLVSGGSTPAALYKVLAGRSLPWQDIDVGLVDERWVSPSENGSNEAFVRETLLTDKATPARFMGMWGDVPNPGAAAADVAADYASFSASDCVILGMGTDGHTASWFPHAQGLDQALDDSADAPIVSPIRAQESAVTGPFLDRMTVTLRTIRAARVCILLLAGDEKKAVYEQALTASSASAMPVLALLKARPDLWVCWAP